MNRDYRARSFQGSADGGGNVAGPQIISALLLATSARTLRDSAAFLAGATLATTIGVMAAYLLSSKLAASVMVSRSDVIDYGVIILLLILIVLVFRKRRDTRPPKWMSELQTATRRFSFNLGFLLFLLMKTQSSQAIPIGSSIGTSTVPSLASQLLLSARSQPASMPSSLQSPTMI
ncbi:MAG: GAP family protein [Candidatus Binatus sp.]